MVLRQGVVDPVAGRVDVVGAVELVRILCRAVALHHEVPAHQAAVALGHLPRIYVAHAQHAVAAAGAGEHHHLVMCGVGGYQLPQLLHRDGREFWHRGYPAVVFYRRLLHYAARKQHRAQGEGGEGFDDVVLHIGWVLIAERICVALAAGADVFRGRETVVVVGVAALAAAREEGGHIVLAPAEGVAEEEDAVAQHSLEYHIGHAHSLHPHREAHRVGVAVVLHVAEKGLAVAGDGDDVVTLPAKGIGAGLHTAVVHRFVGLHRRHAAVVGVGVDQLARDHLIEGLLAEVPGGSHRQQEGLPLQPPVGVVVVVHRAVGVSGARAVVGVDPRQTAAVVFEHGAAERRAVVHRAADFTE